MQGSPETTESSEKTIADLRKYAQDLSFDRVEETWIEAMDHPGLATERLHDFLACAERFIGDEKKIDRVGALLEILLSTVGEGAAPASVLRLHWLLVRCYPEKKNYRAAFADRFEALYPVATAERALYEASGFPTTADAVAALERLEKLFRFREGAYVYHPSGWGVGRVVAIDPFLKQVKVDLEHKPQHRISIDVVDSILEPLAPDSFLALQHEGGAELKRLKDEDPVRLMSIFFESFGNPLPLKDIKPRLVPAVVEADGWTRWWNRVKGLLRDTGLFRVGDRAPYLVEKLAKAVSYEDELIARFHRASWSEARQIARQVARRNAGELVQAWGRIREGLLKVVAGTDRVQALEAAIILDRGEGGEDKEALRTVIGGKSQEELVEILRALPGVDDQRRAVESLPSLRPEDWREIGLKLFLGKKDSLRDAALDLLEATILPTLQDTIRDLIRSPKSSPRAFCHVLVRYLEGSDRPALEPFREKGHRDLLVLSLDLLDHLQHRGPREGRVAMKESVGKVEAIMIGDGCRMFRAGLEEMVTDERLDVHARLVRNESLTPQVKGLLLDTLMEVEPSVVHSQQMAPWEEENVIYTTREGLERRQGEYRELTEVKLKKVIEDIGRAAAFGDLSENAEYTAALEERDHLAKRASTMKADLDRAKIIEPSLVKPNHVSLGSRIRLRNTRTGEDMVYDVLGPWDGSPEDGVLSYRSPLGAQFLGKKRGQTVDVTLPGGAETFELVETGSFFDAKKK